MGTIPANKSPEYSIKEHDKNILHVMLSAYEKHYALPEPILVSRKIVKFTLSKWENIMKMKDSKNMPFQPFAGYEVEIIHDPRLSVAIQEEKKDNEEANEPKRKRRTKAEIEQDKIEQ